VACLIFDLAESRSSDSESEERLESKDDRISDLANTPV